jgi:16S rRNA (cytidine1402-2'-O)-methyltransferase
MEGQRQGQLTVIATPIGNLGDLSPRAVEALRQADLIAAEDTRRTRQLLTHWGLQKPLESFHGDSDALKQQRLVRQLAAGRHIALVSDGGVPGIADPGRELVAAAAAAGVSVVPIPGPSALTTALSVSGLVADRFVFGGFPPRKTQARETYLQQLLDTGLTVVLYEAPHRVRETLKALEPLASGRDMVIARELTKVHEEVLRGTAAQLARILADREPLGEFVILIGPGESRRPKTPLLDAGQVVAQLRAAGLSARDTADLVASWGLSGRREAYQRACQVKKELDSDK